MIFENKEIPLVAAQNLDYIYDHRFPENFKLLNQINRSTRNKTEALANVENIFNKICRYRNSDSMII